MLHAWQTSRLITGFVTRLTRRVPLVEQELPTLPEHLNSHPVFSGVRVVMYLYFTVYFRDHRDRLWSTVTCISLFILGTVVIVSGLLLLVFHCLF
jgi:hypothetical protein